LGLSGVEEASECGNILFCEIDVEMRGTGDKSGARLFLQSLIIGALPAFVTIPTFSILVESGAIITTSFFFGFSCGDICCGG
jgi:hypothetical protein